MTKAIEDFFSAWSMQDPDAQASLITQCVAQGGTYSDPRSGARLSGPTAIAEYVSMFSANAPGWSAEITESDTINNYTRAIVKFGGKGPDGQDMAQYGTYFVDLDENGLIVAMAGFVGETPS